MRKTRVSSSSPMRMTRHRRQPTVGNRTRTVSHSRTSGGDILSSQGRVPRLHTMCGLLHSRRPIASFSGTTSLNRCSARSDCRYTGKVLGRKTGLLSGSPALRRVVYKRCTYHDNCVRCSFPPVTISPVQWDDRVETPGRRPD